MNKQNMHFDTLQAKIYRDNYRPSNIYRFLGSLFSILLQGQSPLNHSRHYPVKRKN